MEKRKTKSFSKKCGCLYLGGRGVRGGPAGALRDAGIGPGGCAARGCPTVIGMRSAAGSCRLLTLVRGPPRGLGRSGMFAEAGSRAQGAHKASQARTRAPCLSADGWRLRIGEQCMELDIQDRCRRGKGKEGEGMPFKDEWWWMQCNTMRT